MLLILFNIVNVIITTTIGHWLLFITAGFVSGNY